MTANGNEVWKWVAGLLASVLTTGLVAWFTFGNGISVAEGQELHKEDAIIEQRQAVVEEKLSQQQRTLDELKIEVKQNNTATQGKLDAILMAIPRDGRDTHGDGR